MVLLKIKNLLKIENPVESLILSHSVEGIILSYNNKLQ
jgi:hypothetical protein